MAFSQKNWRQDVAERWPRLSKVERLTIYFGVLDLLLLIVWQIASLFGAGESLGGWFRFLAFITIFLGLLTFAGFLRRKVMWRLRNRLIVTYVFIGVIPVVLLILIGLISTYLFGWQFATYIATSDIRNELSTISTLNHQAATDVAAKLSRGATLSPALLAGYALPTDIDSVSGLTVWYDGKAVATPKQEPASPPPGGAKEAKAVVIEGNRLLLRVAETVPAGKQSLIVISSVPLDQKMLDRIGAHLGEVTLWPPQEQRGRAKKSDHRGITVSTTEDNKRDLTVGDETLDLSAPDSTTHTIRAGKLPPPAFTFDRMITGGAIIDVLDWRKVLSQAIAIILVTPLNFLGNKLWSFRR